MVARGCLASQKRLQHRTAGVKPDLDDVGGGVHLLEALFAGWPVEIAMELESEGAPASLELRLVRSEGEAEDAVGPLNGWIDLFTAGARWWYRALCSLPRWSSALLLLGALLVACAEVSGKRHASA